MFFMNFDTQNISNFEKDIIIIGSGIGGLTTAITLKELGLNPFIITRGTGNTYYSQGGIAAAVKKGDSPLSHAFDTLKAGRNLGDEDNIKILTDEGPKRIVDLERWGVRFDRDSKAEFDCALEGGHSFKRVLKVKDYTGRAIYEALLSFARKLNIEIIEGELLEILIDEGNYSGVLCKVESTILAFYSKFLVIATGGGASIYRYTSNPEKMKGDSIGTSFRAGLVIENPEFIQFHPTVFKDTNLLLTEALRGEGAKLLNDRGERFVNELEPRDKVARAIFKQMQEGKRVFLDLRDIKNLSSSFPTVFSYIKQKGLDPYKDLIPISPAAHYYIGGIRTDSFAKTNIEGIYAVGEVASTRIHGANRLASNSLLEGVVFGYRAAYSIALNYLSKKLHKKRFVNKRDEKDIDCTDFLEKMKDFMWKKAGLERDQRSLEELERYLIDIINVCKTAKSSLINRSVFDVAIASFLTVVGALARKESRGVHYRVDFPYERMEYSYTNRFDKHVLNIL